MIELLGNLILNISIKISRRISVIAKALKKVLFSDLTLFKLLHHGMGQYIQKHIKTNIHTPKRNV